MIKIIYENLYCRIVPWDLTLPMKMKQIFSIMLSMRNWCKGSKGEKVRLIPRVAVKVVLIHKMFLPKTPATYILEQK